MKAFLVYCYSQKNAGDMAITMGAVDLLREYGYEVTIMSRYPEEAEDFRESTRMIKERYSDSVTVIPCIFVLDRSATMAGKLMNYYRSMRVLTGNRYKRLLDDILQESDLVLFNGGNLLRSESVTDFLRLIALDFPLSRARKQRRPYVVLPQSSARINWIGKLFLRRMLGDASVVFVREKISYQALTSMFPNVRFQQTLDAAFFIKAGCGEHRAEVQRNVALTFRAWSVGDMKEFGQDVKSRIIEAYVSILKKNPGAACQYHVICQGKKDYEFSKQASDALSRELRQGVQLHYELDPVRLKALYSSMDFIVGMRLHSLILAFSVGVPGLGVFLREWGNKNPGMMQHFQMPYMFLDEPPLKNIWTEFDQNAGVRFYEEVRRRVVRRKTEMVPFLTEACYCSTPGSNDKRHDH